MSRFFRDFSSGSESEESEEEEIQKPAAPTSRVYQFSDDDDDVKRVVRSAKDKRFDILQSSIKNMRNSMKITDISKVQTEYENLTRDYDKSKAVIAKEGIPNFYIKILGDLEDYIQQQWEDTDSRKKLSKPNARSLSSLRQKLKKYNKGFEAKIQEYKTDPSKFDEVEEEDVVEEESKDSDVEETADVIQDAEKELSKPKTLDDDDDSDDFFASDSDDSDSEDELPEGGRKQWGAWMFLKDTTSKDDKKSGKRDRDKKPKPAAQKKVNDEGWTEVSKSSTKALFPKDTEINHQAVQKKFHEILAVRGKKGTDRSEQIEYFSELKKIAGEHELGEAIDLKLAFTIAAAIMDSTSGADSALKSSLWEKLLTNVEEILKTIESNPDIVFEAKVDENVEDKTKPYTLQEDPVTLLERVDAEFIKILQSCDGHSPEYITKLKNEVIVVKFIDQLMNFYETKKSDQVSHLCRIYLMRIEHTYYKLDVKVLREITTQIKVNEDKKAHVAEETGEEKADTPKETEPEPTESTEEVDDLNLMNKLCKFVYANGADRIRTRAMLCQIFHHAKHDRWYEARDLMLISHLQETIQHSDILTQILFNRTMVQLGLCAFRHSMIREAHNALQDIQSTGRAKELLAQGLILKNQDRTPEQEKLEKRRMLPFHMHINLELLECVYLTSAMLLEIPYMAAHEFDYRRRPISKSFHYQLRMSDKQSLVGPPESMREHIVAASKVMKLGDWKACKNFILAVSCWELFPHSDKVKEMLARKIQEESLRTYLFTYNKVYDSISMHSLAEMFELSPQIVHSTISKMIINEELQASWDEPTQTLVLHHGAEPTYLQSLTLQLSDKLNTLVDHHERILEFKYGPLYQREKNNKGDKGHHPNNRVNNKKTNIGGKDHHHHHRGNKNKNSDDRKDRSYGNHGNRSNYKL